MLTLFTRSRSEPDEIRVAGLDVPILLRRNARARRLILRVDGSRGGAVLTLPGHVGVADAEAFVQRHLGWLRRQLASLPERVPFADGATVPFRGRDHVLRFAGEGRRRGIVWIDEREAEVPVLCVAGAPEHAPRRLQDWFKRQARSDLSAAVAGHAERLRLRPKRVSVRDQTSRWGSCSGSGTLSFSWRLVLAPPHVLDYVAAHEVAHLAEMNHGPRFWALVRETMPDMDTARRWLKTHGPGLHRYGA